MSDSKYPSPPVKASKAIKLGFSVGASFVVGCVIVYFMFLWAAALAVYSVKGVGKWLDKVVPAYQTFLVESGQLIDLPWSSILLLLACGLTIGLVSALGPLIQGRFAWRKEPAVSLLVVTVALTIFSLFITSDLIDFNSESFTWLTPALMVAYGAMCFLTIRAFWYVFFEIEERKGASRDGGWLTGSGPFFIANIMGGGLMLLSIVLIFVVRTGI